jgi:uncharacterized metal-binding protein YceD (DUF177 family)
MENPESVQVEFSRPVSVEQISVQETVREISANEGERSRLAERFELLALDRLQAVVRLQRVAGGMVRVRGHLDADVVQACVVTLEPVASRLAEEFTVTFASGRRQDGGEVVVSVDEEDPPEIIRAGRIDLGEVVAQQLAISLDPYPRSSSAPPITPSDAEPSETRQGKNPFAVLEELRGRKGRG